MNNFQLSLAIKIITKESKIGNCCLRFQFLVKMKMISRAWRTLILFLIFQFFLFKIPIAFSFSIDIWIIYLTEYGGLLCYSRGDFSSFQSWPNKVIFENVNFVIQGHGLIDEETGVVTCAVWDVTEELMDGKVEIVLGSEVDPNQEHEPPQHGHSLTLPRSKLSNDSENVLVKVFHSLLSLSNTEIQKYSTIK